MNENLFRKNFYWRCNRKCCNETARSHSSCITMSKNNNILQLISCSPLKPRIPLRTSSNLYSTCKSTVVAPLLVLLVQENRVSIWLHSFCHSPILGLRLIHRPKSHKDVNCGKRNLVCGATPVHHPGRLKNVSASARICASSAMAFMEAMAMVFW